MASLKVFAVLLFLGCCSTGSRAQSVTPSASLNNRFASVRFEQGAGRVINYTVTLSQPEISSLAIYSLPTRTNLGPTERCSNIGMQVPLTITPTSTTTGTIADVGFEDILYRSFLVTFNDGGVVCATISLYRVGLPLARVDFVRGIVGTLYFLQDATTGAVFIRGELLSADGDSSIFPLNLYLHSGSNLPAYENEPVACTTSDNDQLIASNTGVFVSQSAQFTLTSYLYKGVSLRSQAGVVLACARLESVNPVMASYVNDVTFMEVLPYVPTIVVSGNMSDLVYPILNEIGPSIGTCIDDDSIFNPWNAAMPCQPGVSFDQCPIGDLRGQSVLEEDFTTATVMFSPLSGRASIIGHAINNTDCAAWVRPLAAANSHIAMATVTFDGPDVTGTIVFRQVVYQTNNELGPAFIAVDLRQSGASVTMHTWHVHQRRVGPNGECAGEFAGGHYNPFEVDLDVGYTDCNDLHQHRCEMGDLSGKHGRLTLEPSNVNPRRTISYFDETLHLWGPYTVMGRSIVVHAPDGSRLACGNIEPAVLADEEVFFYFPLQNGDMPNDVDRIELNSEIAEMAAVPLGTVLVYDVTNTTVNGNECFNATIRVTGSDSTMAESNRMAVYRVDRNNLSQFSAGFCGAGTGLASFSISLISLLALGVASLYLME